MSAVQERLLWQSDRGQAGQPLHAGSAQQPPEAGLQRCNPTGQVQPGPARGPVWRWPLSQPCRAPRTSVRRPALALWPPWAAAAAAAAAVGHAATAAAAGAVAGVPAAGAACTGPGQQPHGFRQLRGGSGGCPWRHAGGLLRALPGRPAGQPAVWWRGWQRQLAGALAWLTLPACLPACTVQARPSMSPGLAFSNAGRPAVSCQESCWRKMQAPDAARLVC